VDIDKENSASASVNEWKRVITMNNRISHLALMAIVIAPVPWIHGDYVRGKSVPESTATRLRDLIPISVRSRVELFKGSGEWQDVTVPAKIEPAETAVVICDVWDKHWCKGATGRCDALAKKIAPVIDSLCSRGVLIIHCPSDCMTFYKDTPQRALLRNAPKSSLPVERDVVERSLPIDDSDGGCDDQPQCKNYIAWGREHPAIKVAESDGVTDNGAEVYNLLRSRGIKNLLVMGVHTNMCVLNRTFAIKQMTKWGIRCILVRDLTDTMYNPRMRPFVPHEQGTELVIRHIEQYWCPTVDSPQLLRH
jgi:nicotinamidase-related amidase